MSFLEKLLKSILKLKASVAGALLHFLSHLSDSHPTTFPMLVVNAERCTDVLTAFATGSTMAQF
jgi:hypothetical protein